MITPSEIRESKRATWFAAAGRWSSQQRQREDNTRRMVQGGAGAADSMERRWKFAARESLRASALAQWRAGTLPRVLERMIGPSLDMTSVPPSAAAQMAGRPVARIVVMPQRGKVAAAIASGFLVTPRLLLTNHHVLPSKSSAQGLAANFLHDASDGGVLQGALFELQPDDFYLSDEELDFALVAVNPKASVGNSIEEFGAIPLIEATPKILVGQPVNIVQYPEGGSKEYAYANNELLDVLDAGFLHYTTDTLPGSSGSPAFNRSWELVALHHAGIPEIRNGEIWSIHGTPWDTEKMNDDEVNWIANEGVRVSFIVGHLAKQHLALPAQQALLDQLLKATSDPLEAVTTDPTNIQLPSPGLPTNHLMANNVFNFSGPVTIHIHSNTRAPGSPVTTPAPAAVETAIRFDRDYAGKKVIRKIFSA